MTVWQAFFLGIVQGITEFLPVSSSGHLALGQYFLGFEHLQDYILFNLVCHLGTLLAILYVFFPVIKASFTTEKRLFWQVLLGTLPLFPLLLILKPLKALFDHPELLGPCFLLTAGLLFVSFYWRFPLQMGLNRRWQDPLAIGVVQAFAVLPGVSRSGATISAARLLGWQKEQALQFSFLLAIPTILGASLIESVQVWKNASLVTSSLHPLVFIVGFITSALFGYLSLWLLKRWIAQDKWIYFAWYCLVLGLATTLYFNG